MRAPAGALNVKRAPAGAHEVPGAHTSKIYIFFSHWRGPQLGPRRFIVKINAFFKRENSILYFIYFNSFYGKIQCIIAFLSENLMRSFHAFSYALWNSLLFEDFLANFLCFDILSQNSMRFCISIAKSNAFFPCHHFIAKWKAFLHFYRKI